MVKYNSDVKLTEIHCVDAGFNLFKILYRWDWNCFRFGAGSYRRDEKSEFEFLFLALTSEGNFGAIWVFFNEG